MHIAQAPAGMKALLFHDAIISRTKRNGYYLISAVHRPMPKWHTLVHRTCMHQSQSKPKPMSWIRIPVRITNIHKSQPTTTATTAKSFDMRRLITSQSHRNWKMNENKKAALRSRSSHTDIIFDNTVNNDTLRMQRNKGDGNDGNAYSHSQTILGGTESQRESAREINGGKTKTKDKKKRQIKTYNGRNVLNVTAEKCIFVRIFHFGREIWEAFSVSIHTVCAHRGLSIAGIERPAKVHMATAMAMMMMMMI